MDPSRSSNFGRIATIKKQDGTTTQDKAEMAEELIASFFPEPLILQQPELQQRNGNSQIFTGRLIVAEVEMALFATSSDKAPGRDGLTARVWKEIWPVSLPTLCRVA